MVTGDISDSRRQDDFRQEMSQRRRAMKRLGLLAVFLSFGLFLVGCTSEASTSPSRSETPTVGEEDTGTPKATEGAEGAEQGAVDEPKSDVGEVGAEAAEAATEESAAEEGQTAEAVSEGTDAGTAEGSEETRE
jgi:hypothetical protein